MLIASRSVMLSKSQQIPIFSQTHSICSHLYLGRDKAGKLFFRAESLDFDSKHVKKQTDKPARI